MRVLTAVLLLAFTLFACGGQQAAPEAASTSSPPAVVEAQIATSTPSKLTKSTTSTDTRPTATAPIETAAAAATGPSTSQAPPIQTRATSTPVTEPTTTAAKPTATATPTESPLPTIPALEFPAVTVTGLIATIPGYATVDVTEVAKLIEQVYPGKVPSTIQALVLLTEKDEAYLVIALDTDIDRFITAGTVTGFSAPPMPNLPSELDFAGRLIVSDDVRLMEPIKVTPDQINQNPGQYAFKRIVSDTTYVFSSVRIKDAPESLDHIGFALASDKFGSPSRDDYLTVIDPYNTEAQIRVASLIGAVLFPTETTRMLLSQLYKFAPKDVEDALSKPAIFFEEFIDDESQLLNIRDLAPTLQDPSLKLHKYHGELVSIQGIGLGAMVRTEDIPSLKGIPIALTAKMLGVVDLTGAMPIVGISSEDVSGEVFGFFRFDLSVYNFADNAAYAFVINKEAVPLDPVAEVTRAEFGNRVKATLEGYLVVETERIPVAEDLTLEQVDLLLPTGTDNPIIMTRHPDLRTGDYLSSVDFDGYLVDGRLLNLPKELLAEHGTGTLVVNAEGIRFEKGVPPTTPPVIATPAPVALPTPIPTPTPFAMTGPTPAPTAPVPSPTPISLPTATPVLVPTPTPVPTYVLTALVEPSDGGAVSLVPPGGTYLAGTEVTLAAVGAPSYTFDRWESDASGTESVITVTMTSDMVVTAHYRRTFP